MTWGILLSADSPVVTHNLRLWKAKLSLPDNENEVRMESGNMDPFNDSGQLLYSSLMKCG